MENEKTTKVFQWLSRTTLKNLNINTLKIAFFLGLAFTASTLLASSNKLDVPYVDERVELLSIIFRLSGAEEFNKNRFPLYDSKIEEYFGRFSKHPAVRFAKSKLKNRLGYSSVMYFALSLTEDGHLKPKEPYSEHFPGSDWSKKNASKFQILVKDFYDETNFNSFYLHHSPVYNKLIENYAHVYNALNNNFFTDFIDKSYENEKVIILAPCIGEFNYSIHFENSETLKKQMYTTIGTGFNVDKSGYPKYKLSNRINTLVHEFSHPYINPVVEKYLGALEESGNRIFGVPELKKAMKAEAYPSHQTVFQESIVRAFEIIYAQKENYSKEYQNALIEAHTKIGFVWTKELVDEINIYNENRDRFPVFESYMTELVDFFDKITMNLEGLVKTRFSNR